MNVPLFYRDKPMLGFDIGHGTLKIVQLGRTKKGFTGVLGYGFTKFDASAVVNGEIKNFDIVASAAHTLVAEQFAGGITTTRAAVAIPVSESYMRTLTLPKMKKEDLEEAVRLETEQYVPVPVDELYIDFEETKISDEGEQEVLMVAVRKNVVDSYMRLFEFLGLEVGHVETTLISSVRAVTGALDTDEPVIIVDAGSQSSDLSIYDKTIRATGTTNGGGDTITKSIAKQMNTNERDAQTVKSRFGLLDSPHKEIIEKAVTPYFDGLVKEVKRMQRYYVERSKSSEPIKKIVVLGGGANMPGFSQKLAELTEMNVEICDPWRSINFSDLQIPSELETTIYTTSVGLAMVKPEKVR